MAIRRVLVDAELADLTLDDSIEVVALTSAVDLGRWSPEEVLVVTADEALLALAGSRGTHRLVTAAEPAATAAALAELCRELDRPTGRT